MKLPLCYREAESSDIPALARIRADVWGYEQFWLDRISRYLTGDHNPQQALPTRVMFVALESDLVVGFVAGHLTRRFACDGELQWINVAADHQRRGIADALFDRLAQWFGAHHASRICVNVDPANAIARRFYARHGAAPLNKSWLVWNDITKTKEPS